MAGRVRALVAVLAFVALATPPAGAHTSDPTIVAVVDAVEPPIDGVAVEVRTGVADQLLLTNSGDVPVEVLGANGKPFLRVFRDRVEAEVGSPDWRDSISPTGAGRGPLMPERWIPVATHGSWGWFDHRLHDVTRTLTPELRGSRTRVRLAEWSVPLRRNGSTHTVKGHVEYRPVLGEVRGRVLRTPPDTDVDVLNGQVPGLFLRWRGSGTLVVNGADGAPFARLTPNGAEVNAHSATWRDDQALRGKGMPVAGAPEPVWVRQGSEPVLTWLDRRLAYAPGVPPDDVARRTKPTVLVDWKVPADIDGRPVSIDGETTWHPSGAEPGDPGKRRGIPPAAVAGAVALAAVAAAVALRARGTRR